MITKSEIERQLKFAKDPEKQIRIIAELNCVSVKAIRNLIDGDDEYLDTKSRRAPGAQHRWTEKELDRIVEMYNNGYTLNDIAISFGYASDTAIRRAIRNHILGKRDDFILRKRGWEEKDIEIAIKMKKHGMSNAEIAKKFGKTPNCIRAMLKNHMGDNYESKNTRSCG